MQSPQTIFIIQINDCGTSSPQIFKIILDIMATTDHCNNITVGMMNLATETRVLKHFDTQQFLILYHSPIPLPSIQTDVISVYNSHDNPKRFKQVINDRYYSIIKQDKINKLTLAQARYLLNVIQKIPLILGEKHAQMQYKERKT
jgi:hypothetical protein